MYLLATALNPQELSLNSCAVYRVTVSYLHATSAGGGDLWTVEWIAVYCIMLHNTPAYLNAMNSPHSFLAHSWSARINCVREVYMESHCGATLPP